MNDEARNAMTKADLINIVARKLEITQVQAGIIVEAALRSIVNAGQEEAQTRMRFIAKYYRTRIQSLSHVRAEPAEEIGSRIPALLRFLGLRPGLQLGRE